jgi:hypothetical protein
MPRNIEGNSLLLTPAVFSPKRPETVDTAGKMCLDFQIQQPDLTGIPEKQDNIHLITLGI